MLSPLSQPVILRLFWESVVASQKLGSDARPLPLLPLANMNWKANGLSYLRFLIRHQLPFPLLHISSDGFKFAE